MTKAPKVVAAFAAAAFSFSASANELDSLRDLQLQLLERFDMLEQEVQMLRGLVEEQSREIQTLQADGRSRYIDLDQRISVLSQPSTMVVASGPEAVEPEMSSEVAVELGDPALENERYQAAFSLIREREFAQAQAALTEFIAAYPQGALMPDAKYWLAQVYEAEGDNAAAIAGFTDLLAQHPDYRRAGQSQLKLGRLLLAQGDTATAQQVLSDLIASDESSELATQARELLSN